MSYRTTKFRVNDEAHLDAYSSTSTWCQILDITKYKHWHVTTGGDTTWWIYNVPSLLALLTFLWWRLFYFSLYTYSWSRLDLISVTYVFNGWIIRFTNDARLRKQRILSVTYVYGRPVIDNLIEWDTGRVRWTGDESNVSRYRWHDKGSIQKESKETKSRLDAQ